MTAIPLRIGPQSSICQDGMTPEIMTLPTGKRTDSSKTSYLMYKYIQRSLPFCFRVTSLRAKPGIEK